MCERAQRRGESRKIERVRGRGREIELSEYARGWVNSRRNERRMEDTSLKSGGDIAAPHREGMEREREHTDKARRGRGRMRWIESSR